MSNIIIAKRKEKKNKSYQLTFEVNGRSQTKTSKQNHTYSLLLMAQNLKFKFKQ